MSKTHQEVTGTAYRSGVMLPASSLLAPLNGIISPSESESSQ
ncbi:hypothetical protein ACWASX_001311 [Klebsiella variicola]